MAMAMNAFTIGIVPDAYVRKITGATTMPASAPSATPLAQPMRLSLRTLMPTSCAPTGACAAARMARPSVVRVKKSHSSTYTATAVPITIKTCADTNAPSTSTGAATTKGATVCACLPQIGSASPCSAIERAIVMVMTIPIPER